MTRKKNVYRDTEQNVREILALLKINEEILGRCMSLVVDGRYINTQSLMFQRFGFEK